MENKSNNEEEDLEQVENEYEELSKKSIYYKLKRWEKNLMKKLRAFILNLKYIKDHKEQIKKKNEKLKQEIKKEINKIKK